MAPAAPDPRISNFNVWYFYPFFTDDAGEKSIHRWFDRLQAQGGTRADSPWVLRPPDSIKNYRTARWFFHEVRALFLKDPASQKDSARDELRKKSRLSWFDFDFDKIAGVPAAPQLNKLRVGFLEKDSAAPSGVSFTPLPSSLKFTVSSLVSVSGVVFFILHLQSKHLSLSDAMEVSYFGGFGGTPKQVLALAPTSLKSRTKETTKNTSFPLRPEEYEQTWGLTLESLADRKFKPKGMPIVRSITQYFLDSMLRESGQIRLFLAAHGRVPVVNFINLPKDYAETFDPAACALLEATVARCHRHPSRTDEVPLPLDAVQGDLFKTIDVTGSQRFHVSSDGLVAFGHQATEFDKEWHSRVGSEYLFTYLLALHQSVICQNLSWRSCSKDQSTRNNERLAHRYLEFNTDFNFSLISNQFNIQRLYRAARGVLGVDMIDSEVRDELTSWHDNEQKEEQSALNSIAMLAFLLSMTTIFINLNFTFFSGDAELHFLDWPSLLFFWTPVAFVGWLFFKSKRLRQRMLRLGRLFWGSRP